MSQFTFPPVTISSVGVDYEKANAATALPSTLAIIGGWTGTAITALKTAADGALQIDVESGHGLATEAKQDTIETTLTAIETDADTIAGAVSGTEMQVDVVAALPAGSNSIGTVVLGTGSAVFGKLAANSGVDIGDVTLNAGTAEIGKLAAGTASIGSVTLNANSGVDIGDVDITSVVPGVGATNLGKAIQATQGSTDTAIPALAVRNDTLADLAGTDHAYAPLQVNATGALYTDVTNIIPGTGATNLGKAIQSAQGTTDTGVPALVVRNDTLADLSGADGDYAPIQVNDVGAVYTTVSSGTINVGTVSGTVTVTGTALKLGTSNAGVNIGTVALSTSTGVDIGNVGLKAGSNNIGDVDIASMPADGKNYVWKEGLDSTIGGISNGILDCSTTNIPSGSQLIVATLTNDIYEIQTVEDIGEYIGIYAGSNLKAILPLGGGSVKINLPDTTVVKLASFSGAAISSGSIAINFLG